MWLRGDGYIFFTVRMGAVFGSFFSGGVGGGLDRLALERGGGVIRKPDGMSHRGVIRPLFRLIAPCPAATHFALTLSCSDAAYEAFPKQIGKAPYRMAGGG